jgi:hypothetical protein
VAHRQRQTNRLSQRWLVGSLLSSLLAVASAGCGDDVKKVPCVQMMAGDLVTNAAAFRLDVFASGVTCDGNDIVQDGVTPVFTTTVPRGQPLKLDMLKPAAYTMLITTYGNAEATHPTGSACLSETVSPGSQLCFSAHVEAVKPGACHHNDTRCCSPDDCTQVPDPAACKQGICAKAGDSCSYGTRTTATICGTLCCNNYGGKCKADCTIGCDVGKGDCDSIAGNGCEHDLTQDVGNCGGCGRACAAAGSLNVAVAACSKSLCTASSCSPGHADCSHPAAPKADDGCECDTPGCCAGFCQITHTNGFGGNFYNCTILNDHSQQSASDAAAQFDTTGQSLPVPFTDTSGNHFDAICNFNAKNCTCFTWTTNNTNTGAIGHARQTAASNPPNAGTDCKVAISGEPGYPPWN